VYLFFIFRKNESNSYNKMISTLESFKSNVDSQLKEFEYGKTKFDNKFEKEENKKEIIQIGKNLKMNKINLNAYSNSSFYTNKSRNKQMYIKFKENNESKDNE